MQLGRGKAGDEHGSGVSGSGDKGRKLASQFSMERYGVQCRRGPNYLH